MEQFEPYVPLNNKIDESSKKNRVTHESHTNFSNLEPPLIVLRLTVNGGLVEYVDALPAEAREEDGDEHAQEVVDLEEGVKEHKGTERPDQYPAGDHLVAARPSGSLGLLRLLRSAKDVNVILNLFGSAVLRFYVFWNIVE